MKVSKDQEKIIRFLIAEITVTAVKFYLIQSIPGLYLYNSFANILISVLLIIILIPALVEVFKTNLVWLIIVSTVCVCILAFQMLVYPENIGMIFSYLPKILGMSFGCFMTASCLYEYEFFYKKLTFFSKIIITFAIMQFVSYEFMGVVGSEQLNYNMSFGFFLVVPLITLFSKIIKNSNNKIIDLSYFIIGTIMMLIMGSRGSILAVVLGCLFCYIIELDLHKLKDILVLSVCVFATVILIFYYKDIAMWLYKYLQEKGLDSRFILMIIAGSITSTTGRDVLQENVMEMIRQSPLFGKGLLCDLSSHNIFLEMLLFFGIPLGIIICVAIIVQWIKPLFEKDKIKKIILIVFLAYSIVDSTLNLTVFGKDMFWIYLGLAISTKIIDKKS